MIHENWFGESIKKLYTLSFKFNGIIKTSKNFMHGLVPKWEGVERKGGGGGGGNMNFGYKLFSLRFLAARKRV